MVRKHSLVRGVGSGRLHLSPFVPPERDTSGREGNKPERERMLFCVPSTEMVVGREWNTRHASFRKHSLHHLPKKQQLLDLLDLYKDITLHSHLASDK
jgi:hypothetical protein